MKTKKHLMDALKEAGLPFSYTTIIHYENLGIIPKPKNPIDYDHVAWRTYTDQEIKVIVEKIKKYKNR